MSAPTLPTPPVDLTPFSNPFSAFWHAVTHISCQGRACRKEYWMAVLGNLIISFIAGFIVGFLFAESEAIIQLFNLAYNIFALVVFLPLGIRRLHDTGRSGWWFLFALVPIIGAITLLIFCCLDSEPGENKYGPNPKGC